MAKERFSDCWYKEVCGFENDCNSCIRYSEMKYLMEQSGLPKSKQIPVPLKPDDCDYEAFTQLNNTKDAIHLFVNSGCNLLICGSVGNGKTSWAIKLLLKYFDKVWLGNGFRTRGLFVHVPTLLLQLKDFNYPLTHEYKENLLNADLVVWDEIGGDYGISGFDFSQLIMYIDNRILNNKSNIFTSNLETYEEFKAKLGERLASRVYSFSDKITLRGKDRRNGSVTSY